VKQATTEFSRARAWSLCFLCECGSICVATGCWYLILLCKFCDLCAKCRVMWKTEPWILKSLCLSRLSLLFNMKPHLSLLVVDTPLQCVVKHRLWLSISGVLVRICYAASLLGVSNSFICSYWIVDLCAVSVAKTAVWIMWNIFKPLNCWSLCCVCGLKRQCESCETFCCRLIIYISGLLVLVCCASPSVLSIQLSGDIQFDDIAVVCGRYLSDTCYVYIV
jgi:hypothetical protein